MGLSCCHDGRDFSCWSSSVSCCYAFGVKNHDNITSGMITCLWALGCLSVKRLILLNWKRACFLKESRLEDYLDSLNVERAASLLKDVDKCLSGHWAESKCAVYLQHTWLCIMELFVPVYFFHLRCGCFCKDGRSLLYYTPEFLKWYY